MEFSFIEAVDFLIKIHKLFRIGYHPKQKNLMFFIEYYFYGINEAKDLLAQKYQVIGDAIFKDEASNQANDD